MLVVFGCVSICQYVIVCDRVCCLRCVVGCVSVGVDALALLCGVDGSKEKTTSVTPEKYHAREFFHYGFKFIRTN